jgi:uncharacterized membrane protein
MMSWDATGMSSFGWLGMGVVWFILLGVILWLVVQLLPGSTGGKTRNTGESALGILDRRLASGQIDRATWDARRTAIVSSQEDRK